MRKVVNILHQPPRHSHQPLFTVFLFTCNELMDDDFRTSVIRKPSAKQLRPQLSQHRLDDMFGRSQLSTVRETESEHAPQRLLKPKKSKLLAKYKDEDFEDDQWEQFENMDLGARLKQRREHKDTFASRSQSSQSISSGFSSISANSSQFVESDTEHSDYAEDFDDLEQDLNLAQKLELRRQQAEKLADLTRRASRLYLDDKRTYEDEFDDFEPSEPQTIRHFKVVSPKQVRNKSSTPVLSNEFGRRSLRKSSSTMDIPRSSLSRSLHRTMSTMDLMPMTRAKKYTSDLDEIDDFPEDLTITLSDYKKLKRKSRALDLSKYAEKDTRPRRTQFADPSVTNSTRLTKEGKLKMIRSLGRARARQVMGNMVYNPEEMKWQGNEEDLSLFESQSSRRPALLKKSSMQRSQSSKNLQVVGNMVYDDEKLRWVSMTGKYEDDPFANFDDTIRDPPKRKREPKIVPKTSHTEHFRISDDLYKSWKLEHQRWARKVSNWFPADEEGFAYCYELKTFLNDN
ncbi:hypothetical protein KL928_001599 [Ogataea angusta]|uniref:Uncharacterized protein n=1 Tax=Pichia angusta TaxID=870730 RepID=A0AAN6I647_PICAN|nr:uncharacterized protein KL928_001599 [Ogataea angusta]KAG7820162.1 hypothetical protein KL928_001599 [Ogataea angusta]